MAQMDLSPVPDPRLQAQLPIAQGAPATPDPQPGAPVSMPTATVPAMPEAGAAEKLNSVPLAFPQFGQQNETGNQQNLRQTRDRGSGISNIHNPILKTAATIGDILLGTFAPRAEQLTPGTEGNYALHLARAGNAVKSDQESTSANVENDLRRAQTHHAEAQAVTENQQTPHTLQTADGIMQWNPETSRFDIPAGQPPEKEGEAGKTITTDQGIMQWNPATKTYDIKAGNAPDKEGAGKTLQDADGVWYGIKDNQAVPITVNGQPFKGKVAESGETGDWKNYQHDVSQGYKGTFQKWQTEDANRKQLRPAAESGTWTLQEGPGGKPVLMNSKTGEMKPAPEGLQFKGTAAKDQSSKDALVYAENYMKGGKFTGPGDLALMDQFYQAAKPKRMNEKQNKLLLDSQSFIESAKQGIMRKFTPNAPYFDDTQRQNIVQTMRNLATSQGLGGSPEAPAGGAVPNVGENFQGGKVTKVTKIK